MNVNRGITSKLVRFKVSNSSTGAPLTGLVYNTSGLAAAYIREGDASSTDITLASGTVGTWTSGGFAEINSTKHPGVYELGVPNAALASGATVVITLYGATNMSPVTKEIEEWSANVQDAVALGLSDLATITTNTSAIPTATANANAAVAAMKADSVLKIALTNHNLGKMQFYPGTGELIVLGDDGSTLGTVQVQIDSKGNILSRQ